MTVLDIIKEYLNAHGYDGLFNRDGECSCCLNGLGPCNNVNTDCEPGYRHECIGDECVDYCESRGDFCISAERTLEGGA